MTRRRRTLLEGAKAIAEHLGFPLHLGTLRPGTDRRKRLHSWIDAGLPVFTVKGRLYAYAETLDAWVRCQRGRSRPN